MTDGSQSLEGWVPELADPTELFHALEQAFDYRGDVTITRADGSEITGYLFDRQQGEGLHDSFVRLMPPESTEKIRIAYAEVTRLQFSDRDPAAGKSWERWVKRYAEKKRKGEEASIQSEKLD